MIDKKEVFFISGRTGISKKTNKPYTIMHVCQPVNDNGKIVAGEPEMLYKEAQLEVVNSYQFGSIISCEFEQSNSLTARPRFVGIVGVVKESAYSI